MTWPAAEPLSPAAPPRPRGLLSTQWWRDVVFLHWPVPPAAVRGLMPAGVAPDVLDGRTYVGLVAFLMDQVGLLGAPGVPYLGRFPETNVRLYSVDRRGRRGVVFLSMDAGRLLPVVVGRSTLRLPYSWSRMSISKTRSEIAYACRRRWPAAGLPLAARSHSLIRVRPGEPISEPTALEHFVTARWALHAGGRSGRTRYLPNAHPPWSLHRAELLELDDSLVAAALGAAAPALGDPVSVLFSPGVPARFGWPSAV
jgi:uncharacterized protein YqjF (DUF2071 family)